MLFQMLRKSQKCRKERCFELFIHTGVNSFQRDSYFFANFKLEYYLLTSTRFNNLSKDI